MIKANYVKKGACIIDVGTTRFPDGSIRGDVDFEQVKSTASFITPVPGGAGPMTVAYLLANTLKAAENLLLMKSS
jgi:methylenetetrahydrofolate dehydrogenase (NADP+)/methenyltetrahydrofolate cyclohydrolase